MQEGIKFIIVTNDALKHQWRVNDLEALLYCEKLKDLNDEVLVSLGN